MFVRRAVKSPRRVRMWRARPKDVNESGRFLMRIPMDPNREASRLAVSVFESDRFVTQGVYLGSRPL